MKLIKTEDAIGQVLCHDITQIIPGVTKDAVFRKGHIIREEDIPVLLSVGKEHLYIWEYDENTLHENEAAEILRDICMGPGMRATLPKEGKIELIAERSGLFLADIQKLRAINSQGRMMIATRSPGFPVHAGDKLAGTRIIPLVIEKRPCRQQSRLREMRRCFGCFRSTKSVTALLRPAARSIKTVYRTPLRRSLNGNCRNTAAL